ncbi:hypothetical protein QL285_055111 [Trifolium repens]|nr:hypothetical protein QL285_055111 [Trifolium repens]
MTPTQTITTTTPHHHNTPHQTTTRNSHAHRQTSPTLHRDEHRAPIALWVSPKSNTKSLNPTHPEAVAINFWHGGVTYPKPFLSQTKATPRQRNQKHNHLHLRQKQSHLRRAPKQTRRKQFVFI